MKVMAEETSLCSHRLFVWGHAHTTLQPRGGRGYRICNYCNEGGRGGLGFCNVAPLIRLDFDFDIPSRLVVTAITYQNSCSIKPML